MSTTDPLAAKRLKETTPPSAAAVAAVLVAQLLGGLGAGYGWSSLFGASETVDPEPLSLAGIIVGMPLMIISSIVWSNLVMKSSSLGFAYGFAAFWFGAAIGVGLADLQAGGAPILTVIAVAALVLAVLFLVTGGAAARRRRAAGELEAEIVRTGTKTTATVSDKGYEIFSESPRILATVTFTFTDLQGVQRWVQRPMLVKASDPVVDGQETPLWYDPTDPGNTSRIAVKLAMDSPFRGAPRTP